jgi:hypothetical protein
LFIINSAFGFADWCGILAGVLILISFAFKKVNTIRLVNIFAVIMFVIYGVLIDGIPLIITNSLLIIINVFYLGKVYFAKSRN